MSSSVELSVVIPAYNEEQRLPRTIERVSEYVRRAHPASEIIVVDDASSDGTGEVVRAAQQQIPELRLISHHDRNHGKGWSVRTGMLDARGTFSLFTDADLSAPIEEAEKLLTALDSADIAIGSRALDRKLIQVHESRGRELAGICFNRLVRLLVGLPFEDTQCGFKAFRTAETRIIFEQQRIEDFGFDPEILLLARLHGFRVVEVPVVWSHDPRTKVNMMRDSAGMFADLFEIRWNEIRGRYPKKQ
jgi:glycosyltransferase involved in cell wall biosynthesis